MKVVNTVLIALAITVAFISCKKGSSTATTAGNWVKSNEFGGNVRSEAISFVIGDTAYIGLGYDGNNRLTDLWGYDSASQTWSPKANFPGVGRNSAIAFTVGGKAYVGTGYDGNNMLKDMYEYDPATNTWTQKADFGGTARYDAVAFGINDKGYVATGFDGTFLKDFWQYDPSADTWSVASAGFPGSKRMQAVSFVNNNKAYLVTGTNNGTAVNDFWSFDPTANKWTQLRDITNVSTDPYDDAYTDIIRSNAVAFVAGGYAYLTTGISAAGSYLSTTWEYNFTQDTWASKTPYERPSRQGAVAFTLLNSGYVATGRSSTFNLDDMDLFQPFAAYNAND